jgi:hypothetical protein
MARGYLTGGVVSSGAVNVLLPGGLHSALRQGVPSRRS